MDVGWMWDEWMRTSVGPLTRVGVGLGAPRWLGGLSTKRRANGYSLGAATFGQGIGCMFTELLMMTGYTCRPGWLPHLRQSWGIGLGDLGTGLGNRRAGGAPNAWPRRWPRPVPPLERHVRVVHKVLNAMLKLKLLGEDELMAAYLD